VERATHVTDTRPTRAELSHLLRLVRGEPVPELQDEDLGEPAREYARAVRGANNGVAALEKLAALPGGDEIAQSLLLGDLVNTETSPSRFRALSLAELRTRPKPTYTVDRYLQADSLAVLEGIDGTYKTFLALAWAHSVALGRPWLERPVQQGRVLYLLGEGSRGLPKRADAWQIVNLGQREDLEGALGFIVDEMPQLWKGDASAVLASNPGTFALIVVDTLARAMVGGNENLQQDMGLLVGGCDDLRKGAGGACVLILHHLNVGGRTRGSTSLPGAISTRLRLERQAATRVVTLQVQKQREDEPERPVALVARTVELGTVDDHGRAETSLVLEPERSSENPDGPDHFRTISGPLLTPAQTRVMYALPDLHLATFATWRDASAVAKSTFYDAVRNLKRLALVEHLTDGHYRLTAAGEDLVRNSPEQVRLGQSGPAEEEGPEESGESYRTPDLRTSGRASPGDLPW
jgi:AAA domain